MSRSSRIHREMRARAQRDGGVCGICGGGVPPGRGRHRGAPSIDHIVPLAEGGGTTYDNLQVVHYGCNSRKGSPRMRALGYRARRKRESNRKWL